MQGAAGWVRVEDGLDVVVLNSYFVGDGEVADAQYERIGVGDGTDADLEFLTFKGAEWNILSVPVDVIGGLRCKNHDGVFVGLAIWNYVNFEFLGSNITHHVGGSGMLEGGNGAMA